MNKKTVLIIGSNSDIAKQTIKLIKPKYNLIKLNSKNFDLSKKNSIDLKIKDFDHLIFFSAINKISDFHKYTNQDILKHYNINFINISLFLKKIIPKLSKKNYINKIIFISSLYSFYGQTGRFPYSVSKFALNGISKNIAVEYGNKKIISNCVIPGFVDTKLTRKNLNEKFIKNIISKTPTKSLITKDQIAYVIDFLLSDFSNGINGQEIIVDGGISSSGKFYN